MTKPTTEGSGEPNKLEIEKKYLIKRPKDKLLAIAFGYSQSEIVQTYLELSPGREVRVRARQQDGTWNYTKTTKIGSGLTREEHEETISEEQYRLELDQAAKPLVQLTKTRHVFEWEGQLLEVDIYPWITDMAVLEVELGREEQEVLIPSFLTVLQDVTGDKHFSNAEIAKAGTSWTP